MLLVHPIHDLVRQLPLLIGSLVVGASTGNAMWAVAVTAFLVAFGVARWFTTAYRIDDEQISRREGVLQRKVLSLPRSRIRSVSTDARLLHRLLGLTVVKLGTGQEAKGSAEFALDAVRSEEVAGLRALLLDESPSVATEQGTPERVLARWQPSWLRYSPLSFTGLAMIMAAVGLVYQTGAVARLENSELAQQGLDAAARLGVLASVGLAVLAVLLFSVFLSVLRSLVTFGNLVLSRRDDALHLQHGLLRAREYTYDTARLRGGTIREPLLVRAFGGARLDAVMTGVAGAGEASLLLPPCPRATAETVLAELTNPVVVGGELRRHGPAAVRRRWTRAMALPVASVVALAVASSFVPVAPWAWVLCGVLLTGGGLLALDRAHALGHRAGDGWLVARSGSLDRRRDCIAAGGVIGWTVRQTFFQRRAGVATLVAATAAGLKAYRVLDVPADLAWSVAAATTPWVAEQEWARSS
nr:MULTISPECIES: PH domain-containing protein [unclassified Mycobacterium]